MNEFTKEKIIHITKSQGYFDVSRKWRYKKLQEFVCNLQSQGILKRDYNYRGRSVRFLLVKCNHPDAVSNAVLIRCEICDGWKWKED